MNLKEKKTRIFIDLKRNIYWMRTVEKANTTVINIMMSNLFVRSIPKQNKTRIDSIFRENESSQQNNMDGFRLWGRKITIIMNLVWIIFGYWEEESLPACVQWSDWLFFCFPHVNLDPKRSVWVWECHDEVMNDATTATHALAHSSMKSCDRVWFWTNDCHCGHRSSAKAVEQRTHSRANLWADKINGFV